MAYDESKPKDDGYLADFPPEMREQLRALREDMLVNAGQVRNLEPGNRAGDIAVNNNTLNVGLNAEMLEGQRAADFSSAGHTHQMATGSSGGFMASADKEKLDRITIGVEENQNAFSNVRIGDTTLQADNKQDTLHIVAGRNISIAADAANDRLEIALTGTVDAARNDGNGRNIVGTYAPINSPNFTGRPTAPTASQGTNDGQIATTAFVAAAIASMIASAPGALDTLNELARAIGNDPNFAATMTNALANKLDRSASCNRNWEYRGEGGQPNWLWGSNNGSDCRVWNPENFRVARAEEATHAERAKDAEHANSADTARSAETAKQLDGKNLREIQGMMSKVTILTGVIIHGATIPLPDGYSEGQCKWMLGAFSSIKIQKVSCIMECNVSDKRIVTCCIKYGKNVPELGSINYMIIGVK
ncbi:hypothetical protein [Selenomonas sp. F0473]|uniref:hypothetical protein n=1 Tax=Selenomonas sp. F0473 TaxID=999423 RepID=UPI0025CE6FC3|nr:hypothetical protein [Selenomonas sp. F0473]